MLEDRAARELLLDVAADWETNGPLAVLREITGRVWRTDVIRHEPDLGDDAVTLGINASRNICNLAVKELAGMPGVEARDLRTLEIRYGGRTLHVGKAPSDARSWDIGDVDWSTSEVRDVAARANTAAYQPVEGTLFELLGPVTGQGVDAGRLLNLHYTWLGHEDGTTREWLGFPRLEPPCWFAVTELTAERDGSGRGSAAPGPAAAPGTPSFDQLGEPVVPLTRRARPASGRSRAEERGA
jgi:hypothetical protein